MARERQQSRILDDATHLVRLFQRPSLPFSVPKNTLQELQAFHHSQLFPNLPLPRMNAEYTVL